MAITTVANCKAFRGIDESNTQHDVELERIIKVVQSYLENECGRVFEDSGNTSDLVEYYSGAGSSNVSGMGSGFGSGFGLSSRGAGWSTQLVLNRPPIISLTDIQVDPLRVWANAPIDPTLYARYDDSAGIVQLLNGIFFPQGTMNIRVRYRGGFAAIPADIEQAAIEMVWSIRTKGEQNLIGVRSRAMADGSIQYVNLDVPMNLMPILDKYSLKSRIL